MLKFFSANQSDPKEKNSGPTVFNLLVTPKQAEALSQAVAQGRIELVLRNPLDNGSMVAEVEVETPPAPALCSGSRKLVSRRGREPAGAPEKKVVAVVALPPAPSAPGPAPRPPLRSSRGRNGRSAQSRPLSPNDRSRPQK